MKKSAKPNVSAVEAYTERELALVYLLSTALRTKNINFQKLLNEQYGKNYPKSIKTKANNYENKR